MWNDIFLMALAIASLSVTVTLSKACLPIRDWAKEFGPWVGKLFSCPYCLNHWLAAGIVMCRPATFEWSESWAMNIGSYILTVFATITLSSIASGGIVWLLLLLGEE